MIRIKSQWYECETYGVNVRMSRVGDARETASRQR